MALWDVTIQTRSDQIRRQVTAADPDEASATLRRIGDYIPEVGDKIIGYIPLVTFAEPESYQPKPKKPRPGDDGMGEPVLA